MYLSFAPFLYLGHLSRLNSPWTNEHNTFSLGNFQAVIEGSKGQGQFAHLLLPPFVLAQLRAAVSFRVLALGAFGGSRFVLGRARVDRAARVVDVAREALHSRHPSAWNLWLCCICCCWKYRRLGLVYTGTAFSSSQKACYRE